MYFMNDENQFASIGFHFYSKNTWLDRDDNELRRFDDSRFCFEYKDSEGEYKYDYFDSVQEVLDNFS